MLISKESSINRGGVMPVVKCGACNGTGTCPKCNGTGQVKEGYWTASRQIQREYKCEECYGTGKEFIIIVKCKYCAGKGYITRTETVQSKEAWRWIDCKRCGGTGSCTGCNGSGWVRFSDG